MDVQHSNTYPLDRREHVHSWVSIKVWVQIHVNHVRINVSCCIVVMIL